MKSIGNEMKIFRSNRKETYPDIQIEITNEFGSLKLKGNILIEYSSVFQIFIGLILLTTILFALLKIRELSGLYILLGLAGLVVILKEYSLNKKGMIELKSILEKFKKL